MPGKRKIKVSNRSQFWPCGVCRRNALTDCIYCETCKQWFHAECEQLNEDEFQCLQSSNYSYSCNMCFREDVGDGPYNFNSGLFRLQQASSYGLGILRIEAKRENRILTDFELYNSPIIPSSFVEIDVKAQALLKQCGNEQLGFPSKTTGDGNCLFNAVSIALSGHEAYATELRLRTVIDMTMNRDIYKSRSDFKNLLELSPSFEESIRDCCKDYGWSSIFTILSLSMVIGKCIRSYYPPVKGQNDFLHTGLSKVFGPSYGKGEVLTIMWSSLRKINGHWKINHFVPVLSQVPSSPILIDKTNVSIHPLNSTPVRGVKRKAYFVMNDEENEMEFKIFKVDKNEEHDVTISSDISSCSDASVFDCPMESSSPADPSENNDENAQGESESPRVVSPLPADASAVESKASEENDKTTSGEKLSQSVDSSFTSDIRDNSVHENVCADASTVESMASEENDKTTSGEKLSQSVDSSFTSDRQDDSVHENVSEDENQLPAVPPSASALRCFKSYSESYDLIKSATAFDDFVPRGNKSNAYFLVDNSMNASKIASNSKKRFEYYDDLGAWDSKKSSSKKTIFVRNESEQSMREVELKEGKYCIKKRVKGKVTWQPLDPQPENHQVIFMNRFYTVLKRKQDFRKRVTFFYGKEDVSIGKIALYEYLGTQAVISMVHGNATKGTTFVRTNPETFRKIRKEMHVKNPRQIFHEMHHDDSMTAPRNFKVVKNLQQKEKPAEQRKSGNIADEILEVLNMMNTHPFVQKVLLSKDEVPIIVCYTKDQILDLRHFLSHKKHEPIGIDRTFNLGSFYVTAMVYKNQRILRTDTNTHPVFIGPMMLHKDASYSTYKTYLDLVATAIDAEINTVEIRISDKMEFGSDDEKALTKAIDHVFPKSTRLLCTKHLKDNLGAYIQKKVGMNQTEKDKIIGTVFGPAGAIDSNSSFEFSEKVSKLHSDLEEKHPILDAYLSDHFIPRVASHVFRPSLTNKSSKTWTNNSAESINNIFKLTTNWKPQKTAELIKKLFSVVDLHFIDYRAAIHGHGNYMLSPAYKMYHVHDALWRCKSKEEKRRIFETFLKDGKKKTKSKVISSKNNEYTVINKAAGQAKKPGQRKRPRNERANKR